MVKPFFYDDQLRRTIIQVMRVFSGFRVQDSEGKFKQVPVVYGDGSRQALMVQANNSENTITSLPRIACYITNLTPAAFKRGGYQGNKDTLLVTEREFDEESGKYTSKKGVSYQIDRLQPVPLDISFKVDVWAANSVQKLQLFEQIYLLFNPTLDIQTSSNPLDWTALQTLTLTDIMWDNLGVPKGTNDSEPNVMTFELSLEGWINPPAKVTKQKLINTIIQRLGYSIEDCGVDGSLFLDSGLPIQSVSTPGDHSIRVVNDLIYLLGTDGEDLDINEQIYSWPKLIDLYGELNDYSKIRLRFVDDIEDDTRDIIGRISYHPTLDNILLFSVISETLPAKTYTGVKGFLDPHASPLPAFVAGDAFVLTDDLSPTNLIYGSLAAFKNDIIIFNGSSWSVLLNISSQTTDVYIGFESGETLCYYHVDKIWKTFLTRSFKPGYFRMVL